VVVTTIAAALAAPGSAWHRRMAVRRFGTFRFPGKVKGRGSHRRPGTGTAAWLQWTKRRCPPAVFPYLVASLSEFTQLLVDFQVDRVSDVSGHLQEEQGLYDVI